MLFFTCQVFLLCLRLNGIHMNSNPRICQESFTDGPILVYCEINLLK